MRLERLFDAEAGDHRPLDGEAEGGTELYNRYLPALHDRGGGGERPPPHGNEGTAPLAATAVGRDRVLQSCNAGVSKCGGARKAPVLLGQKKEALADAIRLARNAVEGRQ